MAFSLTLLEQLLSKGLTTAIVNTFSKNLLAEHPGHIIARKVWIDKWQRKNSRCKKKPYGKRRRYTQGKELTMLLTKIT